ncbi:hypothetical protein DFA_03855 [Cavenderia fasciculata]|uniref:Uncharacterized protein n=1 Tax=Cavenderia fasciculata TaxID=261658 RepID=F4Q0L0_CACFS|nr:uncharacterized protein DFA_03855 [Cavenderia fasciculata]EGG18361.1 hypothetical protein DFA_03855 [Cavenderia fasciculata]|eukprot:XP_004366265.1 hypothetical protein DFA_03855 [Cavenderia fasciculata]
MSEADKEEDGGCGLGSLYEPRSKMEEKRRRERGAAASVSVALVPITTISASPAAAAATTTTTTTLPTVYQRLIGDRVKPTFPLRQVQRIRNKTSFLLRRHTNGDEVLQAEVLRSLSMSKHGRGIKTTLDPKGEKINKDGTVFMSPRDFSCINIIRKMHKEAKDGKKNYYKATHKQLRDFGFKFANGAFTNANKHHDHHRVIRIRTIQLQYNT